MIEDTSVLCCRALYFNWLIVRHRAQLVVSIRALQPAVESGCLHLWAQLHSGLHLIYI